MQVADWIGDVLYPASWPGWLCWLFGHEPTEPSAITKTTRCRCGAVRMPDEQLVQIGLPRWWTRLIRRLPARRYSPWRGTVVSSYRSPKDQADLERLATSNHGP